MQLAGLDPGQADEDRRAPVRRLARELLAGGAAGLLEGGLQHQVLGRVAGEVELRRHHEVGAEGGRLRARLAQPVAVAGDVADDEGDLREGDDEAVCGRGHGGDLKHAPSQRASEAVPADRWYQRSPEQGYPARNGRVRRSFTGSMATASRRPRRKIVLQAERRGSSPEQRAWRASTCPHR